MSTQATMKPQLMAAALTGLVAAAGTQAAQPYTLPDDSYISISGTVTSPTADTFVLDYGEGTILVEMDDWDSYGDAHGLLDGDKVTVMGEIDDDLFEMAKIEAGSVYVENLNTYFYANSDDEESMAYQPHYWTAPTPVVVSAVTLRGDVTGVDADAGEFTIDSAGEKITVDTASLAYNPLDDNGFQQIDEGDYVSVTGMIDYAFIDGHHFEAGAVSTLVDEENS